MVVCLGAGAVTCCVGGPTVPDAPPLDIRGRYDVEWFVGYTRPDGKEDHTLPHGYCLGVVVISKQGKDSFSGTIVTPNNELPVCHAGSFPIHGTLVRHYQETAKPNLNYNQYDMLIDSDVEPLLDCRYAGKSPGNEGFGYRGSGTVASYDSSMSLVLAFGNIYTCASGRWVIIAGVSGGRRIGP